MWIYVELLTLCDPPPPSTTSVLDICLDTPGHQDNAVCLLPGQESLA